jgi:hypothetical protein
MVRRLLTGEVSREQLHIANLDHADGDLPL